MYLVCKEKGR